MVSLVLFEAHLAAGVLFPGYALASDQVFFNLHLTWGLFDLQLLYIIVACTIFGAHTFDLLS